MNGSFQFGASVLLTSPGLNDTFVTLTLAEKLTPPSFEFVKKTSSAVIGVCVLNLLSYHATSTIPPDATIVGKKCWPVVMSFILRGAVQEPPPSVDRVMYTLEFPSLTSSKTMYTP